MVIDSFLHNKKNTIFAIDMDKYLSLEKKSSKNNLNKEGIE